MPRVAPETLWTVGGVAVLRDRAPAVGEAVWGDGRCGVCGERASVIIEVEGEPLGRYCFFCDPYREQP